jgi:hypothetical protein
VDTLLRNHIQQELHDTHQKLTADKGDENMQFLREFSQQNKFQYDARDPTVLRKRIADEQ